MTFPRPDRCFHCNAPFTRSSLRDIYCCVDCLKAHDKELSAAEIEQRRIAQPKAAAARRTRKGSEP